MKVVRQLGVLGTVILCLPGCMLELVGSTAIQSGLAAEGASVNQKALGKAQGFSDEKELNSAIQAHFAEYGYFPGTLQALVPQFIAEIPATSGGYVWHYDPASGSAYLGSPVQQQQQVAQIPPPSDADYAAMQTIHNAVAAYGQNTGYYPNTLNDLAPTYMASVPKTTSGKNFKYDAATGSVYHPYDVQQARQADRAQQQQVQTQQRRGMPAGAGGPLGETLTGINIQQQMNGTRQGGTASAGTAGRQNARNVGAQQNQKHERAMRELGL